ncbi:hypothetical protein ACSSS7_000994 [Eimeria intestinalis]
MLGAARRDKGLSSREAAGQQGGLPHPSCYSSLFPHRVRTSAAPGREKDTSLEGPHALACSLHQRQQQQQQQQQREFAAGLCHKEMRGFLLGAAFVSWVGLQQLASAAAATQQQQQQQEEEVLVCEGHVTASQEHAAALGSIDLTRASVTLIVVAAALVAAALVAAAFVAAVAAAVSKGFPSPVYAQSCFSSGYYLLPVDEETAGKPFTLRVEGPPEWVFETQERHLPGGKCHKDIDFKVIGFAVAGEVVSYATGEGVEGVPLLLQPAEPAAATAAAAAAAAAGPATEAAGVRGVTKRDGSFALATSGPGVSKVTLGAPLQGGPKQGGPPSWALSPQQHTVEVDAAGRVSPPRVTFKLVAAHLQARGPAGLGAMVAAVLLLPPACPAVASANCGAPRLSAAAAAALLSPAALAAAAPAEAKALLKTGSEARLCATAIDEESGSFDFPLAPLCSSWLMLSAFALHKHQQEQQQHQRETARLSFSPKAQLVEVAKGTLRAVDFELAGAAVRGRVVLQKGDSLLGVSGAKLLINGVDSGVQTARDGTFLLPFVEAKPFTLTAEKEGMRFEALHLEKLPLPWVSLLTLRATGVSVCGLLPAGVEAQVQLGGDPTRLSADSNVGGCYIHKGHAAAVAAAVAAAAAAASAPAAAASPAAAAMRFSECLCCVPQGRVCFYATPHSEMSVQLTGGGLAPSVRALRIEGEPLLNVQLMHATYTLRGRINCSSDSTAASSTSANSSNHSSTREALAAACSPQRLLLRLWAPNAAPQDIPLQVQQQQQQQKKHELTLGFSLEGLPQGSYRLELTEKAEGAQTATICWQKQSMTVSLPYKAGEAGAEEETSDGGASVSFVAVGFQVRGSSSDPMFVSLSAAGDSKNTAGSAAQRWLSYFLPRGPFALCVPCLSCTYTLKPASWLRVDANPSVLSAAAGTTGELLTKLEARRVIASVSVALPRSALTAAGGAAAGAAATLAAVQQMQLHITAMPLRSSGDETQRAATRSLCVYSGRQQAAASAAGAALFTCELWLAAAASWQLQVESQDKAEGLALLPSHLVEFHPPQQQQQQQQQQQSKGGAPLLWPGGDPEPEGPTVQLVVHSGCRLVGQISPPTEGVRIEFYTKDPEAVLASCVSDSEGRCFSVLGCSLLPEKRQHLAARAEQQGFDFVEETLQPAPEKAAADAATGTTLFLLRATKHSSVSVLVTEETTGLPLAGVLLSLFETGASQRERAHRQRKVTKETGAVSFSFLPTGLFSLKPILKGYAFSPPLQQLQVMEGQDLSVHLKARRVAFDCKGFLRVIGDTDQALQHTVHETFIIYQEEREKQRACLSSRRGSSSTPARAARAAAVASDGFRVEAPVSASGAFHLKALRPGIEYEVGVSIPEGLEVEAIEPPLRRILMNTRLDCLCFQVSPAFASDVSFIAFLPPPTSVMLSADVRETFGVGEPEDHDESLLVLFLPLKASATHPQSHPNSQGQHPQQQQQQQLAEAAAATATAPPPAAEEGTAADAPLDLPQGTVAAKLPATGVLLLSGVAAGSYRVVLIKTRSRQGSTIPLRSGSKVCCCFAV